MKILLLLLVIVTFGISSCKKDKIEGKVKTNKSFAKELRSSPETLTINSNNLKLTTSLWRDFMPGSHDGDGSLMMAINFLSDIDSLNIESGITLTKQYVIHENKIWTRDYTETKQPNSYTLQGFTNGGPRWGPNINVDVVCEFEYSGSTYRVLAKTQEIRRTE